MLALLLVRLAEVNTKQTWPTLRSELDDMHLVELESEDGKVWQKDRINSAATRYSFPVKLPGTPKKLDISLWKGSKT